MNYDSLKRPTATIEVDLGRDRVVPARMIGTAEQLAIYRSIPEPEPPIVGENLMGDPVRDDGAGSYQSAMLEWKTKQAVIGIAVSIGYTPDGLHWEVKHIADPLDSSQSAAALRVKFKDAEGARKQYAKAAIREFMGDGAVEGLLNDHEISNAWRSIRSIGIAQAVAGSAEGNSSSGQDPDHAAGTDNPEIRG